jgi:hypothetical protein
MLNMEFCLQLILLSIFISWAIIMLAVIKGLAHFKKFDDFKERNDAELNIIAGYLKKIHEQGITVSNEMKRSSRLLAALTSAERTEFDNLNYVDNGIHRDLRHEDVKIELGTKGAALAPATSADTQPITEKKN